MTREEFTDHVEREQAALRGFLLALCCGNRDEADDIAQDALVRAYLSLPTYRDQGRFRSWLFKIAHNTFLNHKASVKVTESIEEARQIAGQAAADSSFEHQDLYLALRTLPPKERSAITLYYLSGYNIEEIAKITDATEDAVKKQMSRGREKLKEKLKEKLL
ncbi:MAG: RNA polymerase sigma factor [Bacteroidales bacterium]|nr:RNA polymerase sigma factor [Bacteroidales bacterium]